MSAVTYNFLLLFAQIHIRSAPLGRVLNSLSTAVSECESIITQAEKKYGPECFDNLAEDESNVVDSLIGTAFVVTQTQITAIVSSVMRLHKQATADGRDLDSSDGTRDGIMRLGSPMADTSNFSRVQVIDAAANYFKHRDEWTNPWSRLNKQQDKTAKVILAIGGRENSTGNLRRALNALAIDRDLLESLHAEVDGWAEAALSIYRRELRSRGLL